MARDTGLPETDAQFDFGRARRRRAMSRLAAALRREPSDVNVILPFDEVVEALGRRGERRLGLQTIPLDSIVGTVDRGREFDRDFRPTSSTVRPRWERIATAQRRGEAMPPIDVYRIGALHFVKDGHHRVSVARALGLDVIDAYVTEVITSSGRTGLSEFTPGPRPRRLFFRACRWSPRAVADRAFGRVAYRRWRAWSVGFPAIQCSGERMSPPKSRRAVPRRVHPCFRCCASRPIRRGRNRTYMRVPTSVLSLRTHRDYDVLGQCSGS